MGDTAKSAIDLLQSVVTALLSWIVLAAISIIISGKLITYRLPIGLKDESSFHIPLIIFKMKAKGEEVTSGFICFILCLSACIFIGGKPAYDIFKLRSGVDIGQWNSLCVMASFLSLTISLIILVSVPLFKGAPVISLVERDDTIKLLEGGKSND
ncbi:hypothetical protein [Sphingomonas sp. NFR04]|uniref:hypothetical protein n=1 Tax=Sphingomonas sp. NFR04 TaxID=1566283 RepID=UPI001113B665|nr:hypothetical protein [Sphingomonas sp. NFR04]